MNSNPKITIGLTTYNSERYIRKSLESLLAQDYKNIELHVYDNYSTDSTLSILSEYNYDFLFIHKNHENIGASKNFEQAFKNCNTPYFMWAGHDDIWHESFISKIVMYMEDHINASLCFCNINFIDADDKPIRNFKYNKLDTKGLSVPEAFKVLTNDINWYCLYGIFRRSILDDVSLVLNCPGPDVLVLAQVLLVGEIHILPDILYDYRIIPKKIEYTAAQLNPNNSNSAGSSWNSEYTSIYTNIISLIINSKISNNLKIELIGGVTRNIISKNRRWLFQIIKENNFFGAMNHVDSNYLNSSAADFLTGFINLLFSEKVSFGVFGFNEFFQINKDYFLSDNFINEITLLKINKRNAVSNLLVPLTAHELFENTLTMLESDDVHNAIIYFEENYGMFDESQWLLDFKYKIKLLSDSVSL